MLRAFRRYKLPIEQTLSLLDIIKVTRRVRHFKPLHQSWAYVLMTDIALPLFVISFLLILVESRAVKNRDRSPLKEANESSFAFATRG